MVLAVEGARSLVKEEDFVRKGVLRKSLVCAKHFFDIK